MEEQRNKQMKTKFTIRNVILPHGTLIYFKCKTTHSAESYFFLRNYLWRNLNCTCRCVTITGGWLVARMQSSPHLRLWSVLPLPLLKRSGKRTSNPSASCSHKTAREALATSESRENEVCIMESHNRNTSSRTHPFHNLGASILLAVGVNKDRGPSHYARQHNNGNTVKHTEHSQVGVSVTGPGLQPSAVWHLAVPSPILLSVPLVPSVTVAPLSGSSAVLPIAAANYYYLQEINKFP